jgi:hypothetical protein
MSRFTLSTASRDQLTKALEMGRPVKLQLQRPLEREHCELIIEPTGSHIDVTANHRDSTNSLRLHQCDRANDQHLTEWVESIVNGTLDTAEAAPQRPAVLLPCCKCEGDAIAYDYAGRGDAFLHGVKCRHGACQSLEGADSAAAAREAWNDIQLDKLEQTSAADMVNHPPHYTGHPSGVDYIEVAEYLPFCLGNAFKHLYLRNADGNPAENIEEAIWHVNRHNETYPNKPELPTDAREALGEIVVHEPHPFGACMLIIAGPSQCGSYDACMEMLKAEAERLRWIAQHAGAAA